MRLNLERPAIAFLAAAACWLATAATASADLIAADQYLIGSGSYTAGTPLKSEPSVGPGGGAVGFASGSSYSNGSGSVNWMVNAGGLRPGDAANAGQVSFNGYTADNNIRSAARSLATVATPSTLWFGITVSQDGTSTPYASNGYALAGFGNSTPPTLGSTTTNGMTSGSNAYLFGLFFGFAHEPGRLDRLGECRPGDPLSEHDGLHGGRYRPAVERGGQHLLHDPRPGPGQRERIGRLCSPIGSTRPTPAASPRWTVRRN